MILMGRRSGNTKVNTMASTIRTTLASCCIGIALLACGGGGGGDRAAGVEPGPTPPGGPVIPPPPILPSDSIDVDALSGADRVEASIYHISFDSPPTLRFTLVANGLQKVSGLASNHLQASIAQLSGQHEDGSLDWVSLMETLEDPVCRTANDVDNSANQCSSFSNASDPAAIPDSARKVQDPVAIGKIPQAHASTEISSSPVAQADGSWAYTLATDPGDPAGLADTYRICLQFRLAATTNNSCIDVVPQDLVNPAIGDKATSLDPGFYANYTSRQVVDDASCNSCHDQVAVHGGGRTGMDYCVTCHNPGSIDANSGNNVDFKIMAHRIHYGPNLPSVVAGSPYKIWGYRNGEHDYSHVSYPQDVRNCTRCHAGQEDVDYAQSNNLPIPEATLTPDGHNWATYGGRQACESCHDDKTQHGGGGSVSCINCHDNVQERHRDPAQEARANYAAEILSVSNTAPGQTPLVRFRIYNPIDNSDYDILSDPDWTQPGGASRLALTLAWSTSDYGNTGNGQSDASSIDIDALANASGNGDGSFSVSATTAIPDGSFAPGIAASGSGAATLEGHPAISIDGATTQIPMTNGVGYFSIDEANNSAVPRRQSVELNKCLDCHRSLVLHGNNRNDNIDGCVTCHNPRNTDRGVREVASTPPSDGKQEESLDFKTMIHAIHAAGFREQPLQIVGFRGFSTHIYDSQHVQYPGALNDCQACHSSSGYQLPLADGVLGTSVDTGDDRSDPRDDLLTTPMSAACSSCHDSASAQQHMKTTGGGRFAAPYSEATAAIETCDVCHKASASAAVDVVHNK